MSIISTSTLGHNSGSAQKCDSNSLPTPPCKDQEDATNDITTSDMDAMDTDVPSTETAAEMITRMMGAGATGGQIAEALRVKDAFEAAARAKPKADLYASTTTRKYTLCKPVDEATGEEPLFVDAAHLLRTVLDHGVVFLETRCAMGKSTAIAKVTRWIMTGKSRPEDKLPPDLQERIKNLGVGHALAECCRKTHVYDMKRHLPGEVHTRYDVGRETGKITTGSACTTVNSIHEIDYNPARTIYLSDEARTNLAVVAGATIKFDEVFERKESFTNHCAYQIHSDADLQIDGACEQYASDFGLKPAYIRYERVKHPRRIQITNSEQKFMDTVIKRVKAGARLLIGFGSKKKADLLYKQLVLMGIVTKIYTGQSEYRSNSADFLTGVDQAWEGVQVVIMNGACTVAVDPQGWTCDYTMLHHCAMSLSFRDFFQLAQRSGRRGLGDGPGQLRCADMLVFLKGGKYAVDGSGGQAVDSDDVATISDDGGFDLKAVRGWQQSMYEVCYAQLVGMQAVLNKVRLDCKSSEARRAVTKPEWLLRQQAFAQV